jgi:mono/diheme cytochrome c family protein
MRRFFLGAVALLIVFVLSACEGPTGPDGPMGATGATGPTGSQGPPGTDGTSWPGPIPAAYTAANGIVGGAAYAKWWTTDGGGSGTQPTTTAGADFYRCKACHAWDGLGNAGSYANRTGQSTLKASRPDVSSTNLRSTSASATYQELYDLVAHEGFRDIDAADNTHPDYAQVLSEAQIWNIVKFMLEEWVDPSELYDIEVTGPQMYVDYTQTPPVVMAPTITYTNVGAMGNEAAGQAIYTSACGDCHGADGTAHDIGGRTLGQFFREKPNEAWFKAKFGEAGKMDPGLVTALQDLQDLYAAMANVVNFPDT